MAKIIKLMLLLCFLFCDSSLSKTLITLSPGELLPDHTFQVRPAPRVKWSYQSVNQQCRTIILNRFCHKTYFAFSPNMRSC